MAGVTKETIVILLQSRDDAVGRALLALNSRQTEDERAAQVTSHPNRRGFSSADAFMGTRCADFYSRTGFLTPKQLAYWRKPNRNGTLRIAKYAGQLLIVAQEKAAAKAVA